MSRDAITAKSSTYGASKGRRIGAQHFAHLRAVAEGLSLVESAERYLGIEHGHQALTAHRGVVDALRTLARRRGDRDWRLIGLMIRLATPAHRPTLEDFIAERDLDGWSESEVQTMYEEAFPADPRTERRQRLRLRQLALLRQLEQVAAEVPQPHDRIDGWFDPTTSERLMAGGMLLLQDLQQRVASGGAWWRGLPAIGKLKAQRITHYLDSLLPALAAPSRPSFAWPLPSPSLPPFAGPDQALTGLPVAENQGARTTFERVSQPLPGGGNPPLPNAPVEASRGLAGDLAISAISASPASSTTLTSARSDAEIIEAWVAARAGTQPTATSYRREARRLLIWLHHERDGSFGAMRVEDCLAYMSFLEHVPPSWCSRLRAEVQSPGWAPFRGPLSHASRRQAVVILASFFGWMSDVGYLAQRNPWLLINRRTGDDAQHDELDSRAFTPEVWHAIQQHLAAQAPCPALHRIRFLLAFVEATGLRASEILTARLSAFRRHKGRLAMQVHGKGARNRVIAVPGQAEAALDAYLLARQLPALGMAPPETPLLASTLDPMAPIGYQALYQTTKRWLGLALQASDLPRAVRDDALRASPHWLRHTFGTRALERKAPLEVVQRQLGHADPRTTMRYAKAQLERLQSEMDQVFGGTGASSREDDGRP